MIMIRNITKTKFFVGNGIPLKQKRVKLLKLLKSCFFKINNYYAVISDIRILLNDIQ